MNEDCFSCGEGNTEGECPDSQRDCGHHCNCSWTGDRCCFCGRTFGDQDVPFHPPPSAGEMAEAVIGRPWL